MLKRGVLFVIVFLLCLIATSSQLYVRRGNLWDMTLERNYECVLLLFKDGTLIIATLQMENVVAIPWEYAFTGREPKDLLVVIHNHMGIDRWSEMDRETNRLFRRKGYAGPILLRLGNGETIEWED